MRKIGTLLLAVLLLAVTVSAQAPFVAENAGLLSQAEAENLESVFNQTYTQYGFAMAVVTADSFDGLTAADYAATCYAAGDYGSDGVLLLVSEQEGQWYIYTSGICADALSDTDISQTGALLTEDLQAGDYYHAFLTFRQESMTPICQKLDAMAAAAQKQQGAQKNYILLGMAGGLLVGIFAAAVFGKMAKFPRKHRIPASKADSENT